MSRSVGEHVRCPEGTLINGRFKVLKEVGCGNFAKVYKCADAKAPAGSPPVAVKILKREYASDAAFEKDILRSLQTRADSANHRVVRMLDYFEYLRCPCFVFALRGPTLRSRKMGVVRGHTTMDEVRRFATQMLETLAFLHDSVKMVHTDLKPENILLEEADAPAGGLGTGWTIADFGSASFYNPAKPDSDLIATRPYRPPESVLGLPWSTKADVWSMACIIFEVFHGARLFETNDDADHLALFARRIGKPVPADIARRSRHCRRWFDDRGGLLRPRHAAEGPRALAEVLKVEPQFHDFLLRMLEYDTAKRASAAEMLRHPWITGAAALKKPAAAASSSAAVSRSASAASSAAVSRTSRTGSPSARQPGLAPSLPASHQGSHQGSQQPTAAARHSTVAAGAAGPTVGGYRASEVPSAPSLSKENQAYHQHHAPMSARAAAHHAAAACGPIGGALTGRRASQVGSSSSTVSSVAAAGRGRGLAELDAQMAGLRVSGPGAKGAGAAAAHATGRPRVVAGGGYNRLY